MVWFEAVGTETLHQQFGAIPFPNPDPATLLLAMPSLPEEVALQEAKRALQKLQPLRLTPLLTLQKERWRQIHPSLPVPRATYCHSDKRRS